MKKRICQIIHGTLLALGVLVLLLWRWSYIEFEEIFICPGKGTTSLLLVDGVVVWEQSAYAGNGPAIQWFRGARARQAYISEPHWASRPTWAGRRGFRFEPDDAFGQMSLSVPHWFIALLLLLLGSQGLIQRMLVSRLPRVERSKRTRLFASIRLLRIAIITAISVTVVVVLCSRFTFPDLGYALIGTPIIGGLFLIVPLIGIWLVRKPLRAHKDRLLIHRDRYLCTACGYNLTANTTGICPECGTGSTRLKKKIEGGPGT
jgi:hypothetical protein